MKRALLVLSLAGVFAPARTALAGDDACFKCHAPEKYSPQGRTKHQVVPCNGCHPKYNDICTEGKNVPAPVAGTLTASIAMKAPKAPDAAVECKSCHAKEYDAWAGSQHGRALLVEKKADSPYCMDCHGAAHAIGPKLDEDRIKRQLANVDACAKCHADTGLAKRNDLSEYVQDTYKDSIHLKSIALGDFHSPACHDCHDTHDIRGPKDPKSAVSSQNVVATCGKCHEGATMDFATSFAHKPFAKDGIIIGYYIVQFFTYVTFITMGLLVIHGTLDAVKLLRNRGHGGHGGGHEDKKAHA